MQRDRQWCDHCNKPYHTRDTCWKLHGKPANWKSRNQRKGVQSAYVVKSEKGNSAPAPISLTSYQLEALQQLLNQLKVQKTTESMDNNSNQVVSLAKQGKTSHSLFSKRLTTGVWIIDTNASDHMTGDLEILSNFKSRDQNITVFMADGTNTSVQGRDTAYVAGLKLE